MGGLLCDVPLIIRSVSRSFWRSLAWSWDGFLSLFYRTFDRRCIAFSSHWSFGSVVLIHFESSLETSRSRSAWSWVYCLRPGSDNSWKVDLDSLNPMDSKFVVILSAEEYSKGCIFTNTGVGSRMYFLDLGDLRLGPEMLRLRPGN